LAHNSTNQGLLAGKIKQQKSDENGQNTLSRQNQHGCPAQQKQSLGTAFQD